MLYHSWTVQGRPTSTGHDKIDESGTCRASAGSAIDADTAAAAFDNYRALDLQRHAHEPLLERVWDLRDNLTSYDAVYIALAEVLDTSILTMDARLSRAPEAAQRVKAIEG